MRTKHTIALALVALVASGCAISQSPGHYRADAEHMQTDLRGSWMVVVTPARNKMQGELLAVSADSLFLLDQDETLHRLGWEDVHKARLEAWKTRTSSLVGWQAAGTAMSLGHGWFSIITMPLWHLVGTVVTGSHTFDPLVKMPGSNWADFQPFSRFPGGLPAGLKSHDLNLLLAEDDAVEAWPLSMQEALDERQSERVSRRRALAEGGESKARPFSLHSSLGPAGLPGAWIRGEFASGGGPRLVAGELLAVDADTLHLWAGGLRHVALAKLSTCEVKTAAAGSTILALVGDLKQQNPLRFQQLSTYPQGLPDASTLEADRQQLAKRNPAAWRYLMKKSRWPK